MPKRNNATDAIYTPPADYVPAVGPNGEKQAINSLGTLLFDQNGHPVMQDAQGRQYVDMGDNSPRTYSRPLGFDSSGRVSYDPKTLVTMNGNGGLIHNPDVWNSKTGQYDKGGINWGALGSYLGLGAIGGGIGAAALSGGAGAAGVGAGSAGTSAGTSLPASFGLNAGVANMLPSAGAVGAPTAGAALPGASVGLMTSPAALPGGTALGSSAISPVGGLATGAVPSGAMGTAGTGGSVLGSLATKFKDPHSYTGIGKALGQTANSMAGNRGTAADLTLNSNDQFERQLMQRAMFEQQAQNNALKNSIFSSILQNYKPGAGHPTNMTGQGAFNLGPSGNQALSTALSKSLGTLQNGSGLPAYQKPDMSKYMNPSTWEKILGGLGTGASIYGALGGLL